MLRDVTPRRRLPGFRFEAMPPPPREVLPRMDIAAFVGFTASGPLHCPVAIEDATQFADLFGTDAPLLWDAEQGETVYALLAPAVRGFLRNGGRRCWVIRVADEATAQTNRFALPGVLQVDPVGEDAVGLRPAMARARSAGSWSDGLAVGTGLTVDMLSIDDFALDGERLSATIAGGAAMGDVLRLRFLDTPFTAFMVVEEVEPANALSSPLDSRPRPRTAQRAAGRALLFERVAPPPLASPPGGVPLPVASVDLYSTGDAITLLPDGEVCKGRDEDTGESIIAVKLRLALADAPQRGELVRLNANGNGDPIWLAVTEVREVETRAPLGDSPPNDFVPPTSVVEIRGPGWFWRRVIAVLPVTPVVCERLAMELVVRSSDRDRLRLTDLGFAPAAPRYWGALPTDEAIYSPRNAADAELPEPRDHYGDLWREASTLPRFPLAGPDQQPDQQPLFTLPLASEFLLNESLPAIIPPGSALERDGLGRFSRGLFLDPQLRDTLTADLMTKADHLRYFSPKPRALLGIHAALRIDEITLIAIPDALHRAWQSAEPLRALSPEPSMPLPRPAWWHHLDCDERARPPLTTEPDWSAFLDCSIRVVEAPGLPDTANQAGTYTLSWTSSAGDDAVFVLEEALNPNFNDAVVVYRGTERERTFYGRSPGAYYYRVRVEVGTNGSDWSRGIVVEVGTGNRWRLIDTDGLYGDLLSVQRALLRMCAARGDLFAVLSLPDTYRDADAIDHAYALRPSDNPTVTFPDSDSLDLPLGRGEARTASYGALYYPWLWSRDADQQVRRVPPDGAVCGLVARRSLARGAWIAPANEPLNGVVALTPPVNYERWLDLQTAQINLIRHEPYGFTVLSADTLALDADLLPINARRLLILLRRFALRRGEDFVFEPHDTVFQRLVRREFESVLRDLFARGAFAGRTPDESYQVVIRSTPQDMDEGRLIVEIKVAPSLPLTFVTVRLVGSGARGLVAEER